MRIGHDEVALGLVFLVCGVVALVNVWLILAGFGVVPGPPAC